MKYRLFAILLVLIVLLAVLAGCSDNVAQPVKSSQSSEEAQTSLTAEDSKAPVATEGGGEVSPAPDSPAPQNDQPPADSGVQLVSWPIEETETFTMFFPWSPRMSQLGYDSPNDFLFYPELESRTNVHINFRAIGADVATEQFNLLIVAEDYPDLFYMCMDMYSGGAVKAMDDEVIIDLMEYVEYMPNYMTARGQSEEFTKATLTDDGRISQFHSLRENVYGAQGPQIRTDWLEKLSIDIPVTYDDWHDMLITFKNELGATTPIISMPTIGGYGMGDEFYQIDGVVHYSYMEDAYLDYLTMCNQWYDEGILDPELVAGNYDVPEFFSFIPSGRSGAWFLDIDMSVTLYSLSDDPAFEIVGVKPAVLNEGDELHWNFNEDTVSQGIAISIKCKNAEIAVQWVDCWYTDEISLLANYGLEGVSFEYDNDGNPTYTSLVTEDEDGLNMAMFKYAVDWGPFVMDWTRKESSYSEFQLEAIEAWKGDYDYRIPLYLTFTQEESETVAARKIDVETYCKEMIPKFILGIEPIENYPQFVQTMKDLGAEELLAVYQMAMDRYNNR